MVMRKIWTVYFVVSVLGWLLAWGSLPAGAYYPPLKAIASQPSDNTITVDVWDPEDQTGRQGTLVGGTVTDLVQQNGVMAWVSTDGSNSQVTCCVYDPIDSVDHGVGDESTDERSPEGTRQFETQLCADHGTGPGDDNAADGAE